MIKLELLTGHMSCTKAGQHRRKKKRIKNTERKDKEKKIQSRDKRRERQSTETRIIMMQI